MSPTPHALLFPLPMQGPVNCMLKLAELLCISGITVTVLNTDYIHRTLIRHSNVLTRFSSYDNLRFKTISDGLREDHPRSGERFLDLFDGMKTVTEPVFREMMLYPTHPFRLRLMWLKRLGYA
ncbi:putative 7-deoxyloganetin glucosyltransferase [Helianthus annuus]|nr:putative 7-deoxyloganetin glucosyltransferase [Helianthus annuus]